jgi:hypothetical protein
VYEQTVHATRLEAFDRIVRAFEAEKIAVTDEMRRYRERIAG